MRYFRSGEPIPVPAEFSWSSVHEALFDQG